MYSQKRVNDVLNRFAANEGWHPEPHSQEQVDEFVAYMNSIVKIESNSKAAWVESVKPLTSKRQKEIRRWIENEQAMCAADSNYFESRYAWIKDESGIPCKFKNRRSQSLLDSIFADLEDRGFGIEALILGARQTGVTTKVMLKWFHRVLFVPNTEAVSLNPFYANIEPLREAMEVIYEKLPWWLPPIRMRKNKFANESSAFTSTFCPDSGVAHGLTPSCVHISCVDQVRDAVKTIRDGLLAAIHASGNTFLILEGQKTKDTWGEAMYRYCKEYWPRDLSRFLGVYIPWYVCSDIYPQTDWLRKYPIPDSWQPRDETKEQKSKAELFVRTTPYLSKFLGSDWTMPIGQQWFCEYNYKQAEAMGSLDSHYDRFAPDDGEENEEEVREVDIETLLPSPIETQKKMALARQKILEK